MANLWWAFAALLAVALLFICYPILKRRGGRITATEAHANVDFFRDHLAEIEQQFERGEIDKQQFDALRLELERNLLEESGRQADLQVTPNSSGRWLLWSLLVIVPLLAIGLYCRLGASEDLRIVKLMDEMSELRQWGDGAGVSDIRQELLGRIEKRLQHEPGNYYYWVLSARFYADEKNYPAALQAYRNALPLSPRDVTLMQEYLQVAFVNAGGKATDEINRLVNRILEYSPNNLPVRGLRGRLAFAEGNYRRALGDWQKVLAALPPEHETAKMLATEVARARQALEATGETVASITVQLQLAPHLSVAEGDTLFVIGRRPGTRGPPLLVKRLAAPLAFPQQVTLDDGAVMLPDATLADVEQLDLVARVSRSGQPLVQAGDLEGRVGPIAVAAGTVVALVIDNKIEE